MEDVHLAQKVAESRISVPLANVKILVIDDDEVTRLTIIGTLAKAGCLVFEADSGITGIEVFRKKSPDLVITDILMPDKDGLETISEIRALDPAAKIIAISSGGGMRDMGFLKMAQRMGADLTLNKPFKPDELLGAVQLALAP